MHNRSTQMSLLIAAPWGLLLVAGLDPQLRTIRILILLRWILRSVESRDLVRDGGFLLARRRTDESPTGAGNQNWIPMG